MLYFANSLATVSRFQWTCPIETPNIPSSKSHIHFPLPRSFQRIRPIPRPCVIFRNKMAFNSGSFFEVDSYSGIQGISPFICTWRFTQICHWTLSWARSIQSTLLHTISLIFISILSSHNCSLSLQFSDENILSHSTVTNLLTRCVTS